MKFINKIWTLILKFKTIRNEGIDFWEKNKDQLTKLYLDGKNSVKEVIEFLKEHILIKPKKK